MAAVQPTWPVTYDPSAPEPVRWLRFLTKTMVSCVNELECSVYPYVAGSTVGKALANWNPRAVVDQVEANPSSPPPDPELGARAVRALDAMFDDAAEVAVLGLEVTSTVIRKLRDVAVSLTQRGSQ